MEPLESVGTRPRQARYQAALRPDKLKVEFTAVCNFVDAVQQPRYQSDLSFTLFGTEFSWEMGKRVNDYLVSNGLQISSL
jgi:hypothetical protein